MNGHRPLLGDILDRQVDHLKGRLIGGENPMIARHGCRKDMLTDESGIGRVNHGCRMSSGKANKGITRLQWVRHNLLMEQ
jgi:hypothetical protein